MPTRTQRRANGLTVLTAADRRIRKLKRDGHRAEIHGHRIWNTSFVLMRHLIRHPLPKRARVLEIGCGWGLLGQFCAKRFGNRVHGVDADPNVLPYLELHAELNGVRMTAERRRFEELRVKDLERFDVILGADICFWDELAGALYRLVRRARRAGVKQVMIADPGRPPFHALAERCEARLDRVEHLEVFIRRPVRARGEIVIDR